MLADPTALPKYLQVSEFLIREVTAGRYAPGVRLPPERQLAAQLGMAVGTLRKALKQLQMQGVIRAVQGSGNYVEVGALGPAIYALFPLERREGGGLPRARVIGLDHCAKPDGLPAFGDGPTAYRIRRIRCLDQTPVAAEEIWLDAGLAPDLRLSDLSESLYFFYRTRLNLWISAVEDRISLGEMPGWAAETGMTGGAACGHFERQSRTADGSCPEISQTWFNPKRAQYVARNR
ncbi:GntR family transcriptional regulator [Pseudoruegeria sp. SK021]|uniref:GntR family transcriptional regulator n=1 Tax=Pseudoruegeria sp. SK021 TaxID=1933035 RepID=UPI000A244D07|nr:GntR family transcriptional regulator [Pseudoruegeria sp. SK021]OSP56404.1 hypothetical protein BV911_00055 [Pseudoruegeria sp. SK021]